MPRAPRICGTIGCPEQATEQGRCDAHQRQPWAGSDRRATLPRHWHTIRALVLKRDHRRCQIRDKGCTLLATEVDHVGDRDSHELSNLRAACTACHSHRSAMQGVQSRSVSPGG